MSTEQSQSRYDEMRREMVKNTIALSRAVYPVLPKEEDDEALAVAAAPEEAGEAPRAVRPRRPCAVCGGEGVLPDGSACGACKGDGFVLSPAAEVDAEEALRALQAAIQKTRAAIMRCVREDAPSPRLTRAQGSLALVSKAVFPLEFAVAGALAALGEP